MNYDRLGRLVDVKAPAAQNVGHASISDLVTQYTELGDRRRIYAVYQRNGDANALSSDKWYNYDAEGRITIVDGRAIERRHQHTCRGSHGGLLRRAGPALEDRK